MPSIPASSRKHKPGDTSYIVLPVLASGLVRNIYATGPLFPDLDVCSSKTLPLGLTFWRFRQFTASQQADQQIDQTTSRPRRLFIFLSSCYTNNAELVTISCNSHSRNIVSVIITM